MGTPRKKIRALALVSVAGAIAAGLMDRESTGFRSLFAEPGNIVGLLLWSAIFFTIGGALLLLWVALRSAITQLTG